MSASSSFLDTDEFGCHVESHNDRDYEQALKCHESKEYKTGWDLAKDTTTRHMQIVEGFSTE